MEKVLFIVFAAIALVTAANILIQRNPLYSALSLIGTLASLSALYVTLHAEFIAAVQIVVYAGAIMVLFIFVIMLLNVPKTQPHIEKQKWLRYLALPFGLLMLGEALYVFRDVRDPVLPFAAGHAAQIGNTWSVGVSLFTYYLLPFEVTSVLILMAVVGAMVLARREDEDPGSISSE